MTVSEDFLTLLTDTEFQSQFSIVPHEVETRLLRLNIYKAQGADGIPSWLLKECASHLCEPIAALYNASLQQGTFPLIWKSAEVVPASKTRPPQSIQTDLRPISVLPALAKIFESLVGNWLVHLLTPGFDKNQFGSLKGRSTYSRTRFNSSHVANCLR